MRPLCRFESTATQSFLCACVCVLTPQVDQSLKVLPPHRHTSMAQARLAAPAHGGWPPLQAFPAQQRKRKRKKKNDS